MFNSFVSFLCTKKYGSVKNFDYIWYRTAALFEMSFFLSACFLPGAQNSEEGYFTSLFFFALPFIVTAIDVLIDVVFKKDMEV